MALVVRNFLQHYNWLFNEYKDYRVEGYPLLGSPIPIIGLVGTYVYFVKIWGPNIMKHRKPYELTFIINVYNVFQVLSNLFIGVYALYYSYLSGNFSLTCQPVDPTRDTSEMRKIAFITYFYYIIKLLDFLDTIFFVLRKKFNQITFLHVYHHGGMVFAAYISSKFLTGSHGTMLGILNAFVHTIMYSYYFLTSFKPELKTSLWWKKYITQVQLLQFAILVVHFLNPILFYDCGYPMAIAMIGVTQNLFMFILFSDFYIRAYVKRK